MMTGLNRCFEGKFTCFLYICVPCNHGYVPLPDMCPPVIMVMSPSQICVPCNHGYVPLPERKRLILGFVLLPVVDYGVKISFAQGILSGRKAGHNSRIESSLRCR